MGTRAAIFRTSVFGVVVVLAATGLLAATGCRPDYARIGAAAPAEVAAILHDGWRRDRGAAGAERSLLAMRKPELIRPLANDFRAMLGSPHPETRRWATCVLLRLDLFREDLIASVRSILSDTASGDNATESRSKILSHLIKNPEVLHASRDLGSRHFQTTTS